MVEYRAGCIKRSNLKRSWASALFVCLQLAHTSRWQEMLLITRIKLVYCYKSVKGCTCALPWMNVFVYIHSLTYIASLYINPLSTAVRPLGTTVRLWYNGLTPDLITKGQVKGHATIPKGRTTVLRGINTLPTLSHKFHLQTTNADILQ